MKVESLWVRAIWSDGMHNAFPGIARFRDHYYVTFRHSEGHQAPLARIFVIRSRAEDLERWEQVAELDLGSEARDPFVCVIGDHLHTNHQGLIAAAAPPYLEWTAYWSGISSFGGPALHATPHGLLLAARSTPASEPSRGLIWTVTASGLVNPFPVPTGGDCAYQTFADGPDGEVLLCYYSSHEWPQRPHGSNPANIYLARLAIAPGLQPAL